MTSGCEETFKVRNLTFHVRSLHSEFLLWNRFLFSLFQLSRRTVRKIQNFIQGSSCGNHVVLSWKSGMPHLYWN